MLSSLKQGSAGFSPAPLALGGEQGPQPKPGLWQPGPALHPTYLTASRSLPVMEPSGSSAYLLNGLDSASPLAFDDGGPSDARSESPFAPPPSFDWKLDYA